jgi:hypothetical protein
MSGECREKLEISTRDLTGSYSFIAHALPPQPSCPNWFALQDRGKVSRCGDPRAPTLAAGKGRGPVAACLAWRAGAK